MNFENGYIPDAVQAEEAKAQGVVSDREKLLAQAKGFDDVGRVPPVTEWGEFYSFVRNMKDVKNGEWWKVTDSGELFTPSQGQRPNCAGFALANASQIRVLMQMLNEYSEQMPSKYNPQGTWQNSKNGSTRGGQTISAIADAGRTVGNCLVADLGEYSDSQSFRSLQADTLQNASNHQIGISLYDGPREEIPEIIMTLCRKGFSVIVGNCVAVKDGRQTDENGVEVVRASNQQWAHATCFGGWKTVGGTDYVFWVNSHGAIYKGTDGSPAIGGWMSTETLRDFSKGQFFDLCAVVYAEALTDKNFTPSLNPWR